MSTAIMQAAEVTITLEFESAVREIERMEKPPNEIICIDLNDPSSPSLAETLFDLVNMHGPNPMAVLVILTGLLRSRDVDNANLKSMSSFPLSAIPQSKTFRQKLRDVWRSLIHQPSGYQRSSVLFEALASRLAREAKINSEVAKRAWRR